MDAETLAALKASIQHWQENVEAKTPAEASIKASDCALCQRFAACNGCPVAVATERSGCAGTPYLTAYYAFKLWEAWPDDKADADWRQAAQAELDFLISILPDGETP
jgi:hypothetical protein